jgi:transcriptional regulator with XRE-family HTH domain
MTDPRKEPTPFAELAQIIENLPVIVLNARRAKRLSQRALARQAGMSFSTVSRIENGEEMSTVSLAAILGWLNGEMKP